MAHNNSQYSSLIPKLLALFCYFEVCFGVNLKQLNLSAVGTHWATAGATWYGGRRGFGSDGGSCGYGKLVSQPPFSSFVTGISPSLYASGKECGACYQVKCTKHPSCSKKPVTVIITDLCPGCVSEAAHFDLSGTSFGAMAIRGQEDKLRNAGVISIRYARVACNYRGIKIAFHVDQGSNPEYFAAVIEFEDGDGDLRAVSLKEANSKRWRTMQQSWGAVWKLNAGAKLRSPLSIRLTSKHSGQTLVAKNVIPQRWIPGATYRSVVNYI